MTDGLNIGRHDFNMETTTAMCVGGPLDGKRYTGKGDRFFQMVMPLEPLTSKRRAASTERALDVKRVEYVLRKAFCDNDTPEGEVVRFWSPSDMLLAETMKRLLENYRPEGA